MSRADTVSQAVRRNIKFLFEQSEILAKKYPEYMVFDYIESWCHMIILHNYPICTIDFDDEIEMLEAIEKANPNNRVLKFYYSCVLKTNRMIKEKYKNKVHNPAQAFRQSLIEMNLMREGKLPKRDINEFLDKLDKEIKE